MKRPTNRPNSAKPFVMFSSTWIILQWPSSHSRVHSWPFLGNMVKLTHVTSAFGHRTHFAFLKTFLLIKSYCPSSSVAHANRSDPLPPPLPLSLPWKFCPSVPRGPEGSGSRFAPMWLDELFQAALGSSLRPPAESSSQQPPRHSWKGGQ